MAQSTTKLRRVWLQETLHHQSPIRCGSRRDPGNLPDGHHQRPFRGGRWLDHWKTHVAFTGLLTVAVAVLRLAR
jgi:hypothetical protein